MGLIVAGLLLLGISWAFANPPGGSPDEFTTYTKAMGTAFGEVRATPLPTPSTKLTGAALFNSVSFGEFTLPAQYVADPRWGCTRFKPAAPATCVDAPVRSPAGNNGHEVSVNSYVAFYPPGIFDLLGLGARQAPNADDALYVGRLVSLVLSVVLLGIAFAVTRGRWVVVGLLAAASPMVLFLSSSFNPSGVEVSAGIAFAAVIAALARRDPSNLLWWAFMVSGVFLAIARPLGFLWIVVDVGILIALVGWRRFLDLFRPAFRMSGASLVVVSLAAASTVMWDFLIGHSPHSSLHQTIHELNTVVHQLPSSIDQFVGVFGWLDVTMPHLIVELTLGLCALLILVGITLGEWRSRISLVGYFVVAVIVALVVDAATDVPFGFMFQARYIMPMTALMLIVSGSLIDRGLSASSGRTHVRLSVDQWSSIVALVVVGGLSLLELVGWWANSHVAAVGLAGPLSFFRHPKWTPPGGWSLLIAAALLGTLSLMAGAVAGVDVRRRPSMGSDTRL